MAKFVNFLKDVQVELGRVNWPTRRQIFQYTAAVISASIFVALFLGSWDILFNYLLNRFLLK